jgi:iron-sulfur cluster repair protein YtfE (RIC family)
MTTNLHPPVDPDDTLNAVVARRPETLAALAALGLDACCGGALSLREAARRHGLDLATLLDALDGAPGGPA